MLSEHQNILHQQQIKNDNNDQGIKTTFINIQRHQSQQIINKNQDNKDKLIEGQRQEEVQQQHQQAKHKKQHIPWLSFQNNLVENQYRRGRRIHGLQLPLHPFQIFGWIALIIFGVASFFILIPSFKTEIQQLLYGLLCGLYVIHTISHIAALLIDPADRELRHLHRNDRIVPEFDRTKHSHVIENGRCHLCNIRTSSNRTKHCSVCNKCVGKFDHHCKWLNHCIGGRNYVAFLMCVVSAVVAALVILAAAISHIVLYHINPEWLNLWYTSSPHFNYEVTNEASSIPKEVTFSNVSEIVHSQIFNQTYGGNGNDTDIKNNNYTTNLLENFPFNNADNVSKNDESLSSVNSEKTSSKSNGIGLNDTIFLIFIGFLGVLAAITAGLLLHLCFFHVYISYLGLTTYEYIRNQRQQNIITVSNINNHSNGPDPLKLLKGNKNVNQIYLCSTLEHPNKLIKDWENDNFTNDHPHYHQHENTRPQTLHCCTNSREYHQSASLSSCKTYYVCSLLEENSTPDTDNSTIEDHEHDEKCKSSKTFHCCSQFQRHKITSTATTSQSSSAGDATSPIIGEIESTTHSYVHFSEQCTFFRIKTPSKNKNVSLKDKHCCLKAISKHHRWKRKWNCCSNVPDSPDVPNDIITTISKSLPTNTPFNEPTVCTVQQCNNNRNGTTNAIQTQPPIQLVKTDNNHQRIGLKTTRARLMRPWPVQRLRHMFRIIGRYRRVRCRHRPVVGNIAAVKQNQIRPSNENPLPDTDITNLQHSQAQSIETILPTSIIRDETYNINELVMPPLPPPSRRKIPSPTDLTEIAETLAFSSPPSSSTSQRIPLNRRQRRKNLLRTRSPTLSPIHESGLSNPTSPQPCRHSTAATSNEKIEMGSP